MTRCTLPAGRLRRTTVPQREGTKKTQAKGLWRSGCRAHVPGEGADWPCIWILAQRPVFAQGVLQDLLHGAVRLHVEGVNDALQPLKHVLGVAARVRAGAQAGVPVQAHEAVAQAAALQLRERPPERRRGGRTGGNRKHIKRSTVCTDFLGRRWPPPPWRARCASWGCAGGAPRGDGPAPTRGGGGGGGARTSRLQDAQTPQWGASEANSTSNWGLDRALRKEAKRTTAFLAQA
ncbi:unnamed protein product [Prorocentrum cordatum]|nr:unnamed protein product [Polarella glacialis]